MPQLVLFLWCSTQTFLETIRSGNGPVHNPETIEAASDPVEKMLCLENMIRLRSACVPEVSLQRRGSPGFSLSAELSPSVTTFAPALGTLVWPCLPSPAWGLAKLGIWRWPLQPDWAAMISCRLGDWLTVPAAPYLLPSSFMASDLPSLSLSCSQVNLLNVLIFLSCVSVAPDAPVVRSHNTALGFRLPM